MSPVEEGLRRAFALGEPRSRLPEEENFSSILEAARAGADWAWTEIYNNLSPPMLGYLRARGAPEPEDLVGEIFLQMVRDLPRFEGGEREFRAWAFTIAHHRLLDDRRHRSRRPVEPAPDEVIEAAAGVGDVEEEALGELGFAEIQRVLRGLSPDQQTVLLLRVIGDLTVEQVAEVVGKREGAVKALQCRALAAVRRAVTRQAVTL